MAANGALADDWRSWSESDLRAVFAHELAHIQRSDYVVGLMARLTLALHFYHPLVRWMARRLQSQQELAADAVGAQVCGRARALSGRPFADGPAPGQGDLLVAGQSVLAGTGNLDQEDQDVASS